MEEEEGRRGKMFKEEEQNWIKLEDTVRIQCGYSEEEEAEEEEEEEGRRGKMFKEEKQNWIKKNVLWRRKEVEEGNI